MMDFKGASSDDNPGVNQLLHIVEWWREREASGKNRPALSRMQAACFDPYRDHNHDWYPCFPCLQQVGFIYDGGDLIVCAYYPRQYIFSRAYGNLLGLSSLGIFMADQLGLRLAAVTCLIGRATLAGISKGDIGGIATIVEEAIEQQATES